MLAWTRARHRSRHHSVRSSSKVRIGVSRFRDGLPALAPGTVPADPATARSAASVAVGARNSSPSRQTAGPSARCSATHGMPARSSSLTSLGHGRPVRPAIVSTRCHSSSVRCLATDGPTEPHWRRNWAPISPDWGLVGTPKQSSRVLHESRPADLIREVAAACGDERETHSVCFLPVVLPCRFDGSDTFCRRHEGADRRKGVSPR